MELNNYKKLLLLTFCVFLGGAQWAYGQDLEEELLATDAIILNSGKMKVEVLELKEEAGQLKQKIWRLQSNIKGMKEEMKSLRNSKERGEMAYLEMEDLAKRILFSNDSLRIANADLAALNSEIRSEKESVELAATALRDVLDKERERNSSRTESFKKNIAHGCTEITHNTKKGRVILDLENTHKLSWIENFTLMVNTCYAVPREEAENSVKVFFYLYREDDVARAFPLESAVPIVLSPSAERSDNSVVYYEGNLAFALPSSQRKKLKTHFIFEVEYQEDVIAEGEFRLD